LAAVPAVGLLVPALPADADEVVLEPVVTGLSSPVFVDAPAGDDRLFIAELGGRIRIFQDGGLLAQPFLDLSSLVGGGEWGLFGMAFHPNYASNGLLYVHYVAAGGESRVVEYRVSGTDANVADPSTAKVLLTLQQPFTNHNGGMIAFGPDGMLYVGFGDGGSQGDPDGHGQDTNDLLSTMVRLDPNAAAPYIPSDNPFVGGPGRDEIWAYGLRNPWRFSFDPGTDLLYIGDVGQNDREEINVESASGAALNYGWSVMEGSLCFNPPSGCDTSGKELPALEYETGPEGCSVTGGYVYGGSALPLLQGHYFYGDFCQGWIRSFLYQGGSVTQEKDWTTELGTVSNLVSFGTDGAGELYVVSYSGTIYRFVSGVDRLAGGDRYSTAAAISAYAFPSGAPVAYVTTGEDFPDALAGGPAAGLAGGPILLVRRDSVPSATLSELSRLGPTEIVILGGTGVVSSTVEGQLQGLFGTVTRLAGGDRYSTAAAISAYAFPSGAPVAYVTTGEDFPDALAGGPAAGLAGGPILLVRRDSVPSATLSELTRLGPTEIVILGGTGVVSTSVQAQLAPYEA
jgi:glucose/arabinose dehydrogenase